MLIKNPKRQAQSEIEKQYDGKCVFLTKIIGDNEVCYDTAEVFAVANRVVDIMDEVRDYIGRSDLQPCIMASYTSTSGSTAGVITGVYYD